MTNKRPKSKTHSVKPNISCDFTRQDDTLIVKVSGEADLSGSSALRISLMRRLGGVNNLIFDLGGLEFADSYFLRLLIKLRRRLGGVSSVKVQNPNPNVRKIFEITGLDKLFM